MSFLRDNLINFGLSHLEAAVYLSLLKQGEATAGILAKLSGQKRSSVYAVLDSLKEKGLISESKREKVKLFRAEPTEAIDELLRGEEERLQKKRNTFTQIKKTLTAIKAKELLPPEIKIYEGKDGVFSLLMQTLWEKPKVMYAIGSWEIFTDYYKRHTEQRIENKISLLHITPDTPLARKMKKLDKESFRKTKLVNPSKFTLPGGILITDKFVCLFSLEQPVPVGVLISNEKIATVLIETFLLAFNAQTK